MWITYDTTSFMTVNAAGFPLTSTFYLPHNGGFYPIYRNTFTYNSSNLITSQITETNNSNNYNTVTFVNTNRLLQSYNSKNQLTNQNSQNWVNGAWVASSGAYNKKYYYDPILGIANIVAPLVKATIFPNPATNRITVQANWPQPQTSQSAIYDATGKLIMQWSDGINITYNKTISTVAFSSALHFAHKR